MSNRVCLDCPNLGPWTRGRCPTCERAKDRARGTKTERGYGTTILDTPLGRMTYSQARARYQRQLDAGHTVLCADDCGAVIDPRSWHLGHHDTDRRVLVGPLTPFCNLSAAGRARHGIPPGGSPPR